MNRRHLVLVALALVALSSVTGAGGVSSTRADRSVSASVVEDGEAYLGIEFGAVDNGTRTLRVTNRVTDDDLAVTVGGRTRTVEPGEAVEFSVACGSTAEIAARGPDVRIEATRSVDCPTTASDDDSEER